MKTTILKTIGITVISSAMGFSFASCATDMPFNQEENNPDSPSQSVNTYFTVDIEIPTTDTRADDDWEATGTYDQGPASEYNVSKVHVYAFKQNPNNGNQWELVIPSTGKFVSESTNSTATKYIDVPIYTTPTTSANVDENKGTLSSGVKYTTKTPQPIATGTYRFCALCNDIANTSNSSFETLDDFLDLTHTVSSYTLNDLQTNGIPMSSRSYSGEVYDEVPVQTSNTKSNPAHITLYVERELARIRYMDDQTEFDLLNSSGTKIGKVALTNRDVLNAPRDWYVFRHVGTINSSNFQTTFASNASSDDYVRFSTIDLSNGRPYVITPATSSQNKSGNYSLNDCPLIVTSNQATYYAKGWSSCLDWIEQTEGLGWENLGLTTSQTISYCSENVMEQAAQKKGNGTCVIFRAELRPTKVRAYITGTYSDIGMKDLTYSEYTKSYTYTVSYSTYTFSALDKLIYYNGTFYANLTGLWTDNPSLFPNIKQVGTESQTNSTTLTYKNLYTFLPDAKVYDDWNGYYLFYIRHVDNKLYPNMGRMEYAVVRNNSYDISINNVYFPALTRKDFENPNIDITEDIETGSSETETITTAYIDATITVRPWIVRAQSDDLGKK